MKKMDSVENVSLIAALLKTKNLEDLNKLHPEKNTIQNISDIPAKATKSEKSANYPGGINALRKEITNLFYGDGVYSEDSNIKTNLIFTVERDGSISNVKAVGDNFTFNRQAEIAMYSVAEKFSPAMINGAPVRYRFTLPLSFNIK